MFFSSFFPGQITPRTPLFNSTKATYEGCCPSSSIHLYRVKADVYEAVKQLESGDIGAIRGLKFTTAGDLLHLGCPVRLSSSFLLPALSAFDDGSSTSEDFFFPDSSSSPPPSSPFLPAGTREGSAHKPLLSSSSTEEGGKKEIALRPGDCPSQNRETHAGLRKSGDFTADTLRESREKDKNAENESPVLAQSSAPSLQERPPQQHHGFPRLYRRRRSGSRGMQILPVCFSSLECASAREEEQVEAALAAASLSDVALRYTRDEGGKFTLWGMGQLHLQVIQATLREQFGESLQEHTISIQSLHPSALCPLPLSVCVHSRGILCLAKGPGVRGSSGSKSPPDAGLSPAIPPPAPYLLSCETCVSLCSCRYMQPLGLTCRALSKRCPVNRVMCLQCVFPSFQRKRAGVSSFR